MIYHETLLLAVVVVVAVIATTAKATSTEKAKKSPPPFFLQDPADSLCLFGDDFRRCSIDTLFYVVGSPGAYQIHKRTVDGTPASEEDDGVCLSKKTCNNDGAQDVKILSCSHCGSKEWNILGDSDNGYVLTEGSDDATKLCLVRTSENNKATLAPCDSNDVTYTPLQLQFASESDLKAMASPAARLMGAASDGNVKLVQELLSGDDLDANVRDWDELTALIPASSAGQLEVIKLLLEKGADVNAADKDGITALMEASIMGHVAVVEALLEAGATVDETAHSGVTALWLAGGEGKTNVVQLLLQKGADPANVRSDGITALMTAAIGGHTDAVKVLMENGADLAVQDHDNLTPLMNAAENGDVPTIKVLAAKADAEQLNSFSKTGFSPLIIAAAHGHTDAVDFLIGAGADVNGVHPENKVTALMYAAASGHVDVIKFLIQKGADLHALHSNGGTALLEAATGGMPDAMEVLLEAGASHNFLDFDGVTPLMAVASQGHVKGQELILEKLQKTMSKDELKAHINLASHSGGTAVMFAAAGGHLNCTRDLIALGANINDIAKATPEYIVKVEKMMEEGTYMEDEPHIDGVTAVHVAAQGGHLECVKLLTEHGADVTVADDEKRTPLTLAVKGNYGEVAAELVKAGADPNTPYVDEEGKEHSMLMDAITVENNDFAKLLIEKGADLYYKDERKVSTLLQAAHRGLTDIVKMLLDKHGGADGYVDDMSDEGITPLISAASEGHDEVVQLLLDSKKADVNAKDQDGTNSLMAASARGHNKVVEVLLKAGAAVNAQNSDGHTALMFAYNGKNQVETLWERFSQYVGEEKESADDSGTGPIIREALDNHTALTELLLKAGADTTLKDKEGHTAKDFDFHPDADAEVLEKEAKAEKVRDESKNEL